MRRTVLVLALASLPACAPVPRPAPAAAERPAARTAAYVTGAVGLVAGATAIGCTVASAVEDASIEDGGYATGGDIGAAASRGDAYNQAAFVAGAVALGAAAATLGLYLYAWPSARRGERATARPITPGFSF